MQVREQAQVQEREQPREQPRERAQLLEDLAQLAPQVREQQAASQATTNTCTSLHLHPTTLHKLQLLLQLLQLVLVSPRHRRRHRLLPGAPMASLCCTPTCNAYTLLSPMRGACVPPCKLLAVAAAPPHTPSTWCQPWLCSPQTAPSSARLALTRLAPSKLLPLASAPCREQQQDQDQHRPCCHPQEPHRQHHQHRQLG